MLQNGGTRPVLVARNTSSGKFTPFRSETTALFYFCPTADLVESRDDERIMLVTLRQQEALQKKRPTHAMIQAVQISNCARVPDRLVRFASRLSVRRENALAALRANQRLQNSWRQISASLTARLNISPSAA